MSETQQIREIKPRKKMKFDPDLKYAIEAHQDCKFAETERTKRTLENNEREPSYRFTFGTIEDSFSGAITIKPTEVIPRMIILMFDPKNECYDVERVQSNEKDEDGRLHESGESSNTANPE